MGPVAAVVVDRTVVFAPDPTGTAGSENDRSRHAGLARRYTWVLGHDDVGFVRFRRHEVELALDDGGAMTLELEPDHYLPWPVLRTGGALDLHVVALREFTQRCASAFDAGGADLLGHVLHAIPPRVRRYIPADTWRKTILAVQASEDIVT